MYPEQQQIYWHSGLYLQPQHFQSLDLHAAWLHARQRQLAQPYNSGLIDISINRVALDDSVLSIDSIRLIMPGGDYLEYPGNCRLEKRHFRDCWPHPEQPLTFWLALRRFDPHHRNVTLPEKDDDRVDTRWLSIGEAPVMKDIYDHAPDASVTRLHYNARLLTDSEIQGAVDCEVLPLLRLCHDGESVIIDPTFSPPAITLKGSPALEQLIENIYFEISARTRKLEEYKRAERLVSRHERGDHLIQLLAMRSLNRALPVLKNALDAQQVHPWLIYNILSQLAVDLSSFSDSCSCLGEWQEDETSPPGYRHDQLYACFSRIRRTLTLLINGLLLEENTYIRLNCEDGIYYGDLGDRPLVGHGRALLLLHPSGTIEEAKRFFQTGDFKLASRDKIDSLIRYALPGIPLSFCKQAPRGVPNRSDFYYYHVHHDSELWRSVENSRSVAFYLPDVPDGLDVQLIFMEEE